MADQPDQLATFTEDAPRAELVQQPVDQQPDITKHRPNDYAALTAQQALQTTYGQGLMPTREQIFGIYDQALKDANQFHSHLAEQQASAITELQKRQQALPILAAEKATEASVQEQQKQFEQGAGAVAQAKQQGGSGLVQRLGPDDLTKLDAFATSYNSVNDLGQYFNKMMEKPHLGVGGQWKSLAGKMRLFADATSPEALAFDRARESSIVPVGRGVMGETGASPTKESMIQIAEALNLPRIQDDEETGNQGIFMLKKRIMQNLQAFRDDRYNAGFDTTSIDRQIGKLNSDFASDNTQKWDPLRTAPIVQAGTSAQADA